MGYHHSRCAAGVGALPRREPSVGLRELIGHPAAEALRLLRGDGFDVQTIEVNEDREVRVTAWCDRWSAYRRRGAWPPPRRNAGTARESRHLRPQVVGQHGRLARQQLVQLGPRLDEIWPCRRQLGVLGLGPRHAGRWVVALERAETVVIGGGLVEAGDLFLETTRSSAERYVFARDRRLTPPLVPGTFGSNAEVVGATHLALTHMTPGWPEAASRSLHLEQVKTMPTTGKFARWPGAGGSNE